MRLAVRPVAIGLILGFLGLFFGIFWAVYLVVNHSAIHKTLEEAASASISSKSVAGSQMHAALHSHAADKGSHEHGHSSNSNNDDTAVMSGGHGDVNARHKEGAHETPLQKAAHGRLVRGHIHAMGLGLITICVSLALALLDGAARVKTAASVCIGVGGLVYPFAWIIMGYRTAAVGFDAAQESVFPIVALSVPLALIGLFICLFYLLKSVFVRS